MGCGSSAQPLDVEGDSHNGKAGGRAAAAKGTRPTATGTVHTIADDDNIPTELLPESPAEPIKPPLAFEIPLDSDGENEGTEGLVKKHPPKPPKRLQRMQPSDAPPSLQDLQDKLESAEKRRQTILQNRIASASKASRQAMKTLIDTKEEVLENEDRPSLKNMTEIKNSINIEGHGVSI